ncbi:helix-turn-helix domain-containing protein [Pantoea ananatis]|uniref:STY4528 family pathogenicity island replication protein n=1 Tax=Pantoea ananas TaxID=553 RepID=UPI00158AC69A|nr:STY4528 family pathogenicity island replication protein [Pantoea ananatis]MBA4823466.1 helix-turn-helix domain-containing protein [Pantoea ananatis]QKV88029.1 helix-turn-helix domain-containing protein [Pantoea ananatis]
MNIPADSIVAHTLSRMEKILERRVVNGQAGQERSGLLFMGNVHDAFPRSLFLDTRLSPLDKIAWVMIRLYAQQNEGAVFPTYDELQAQLASAHSDKASRETVSRTLLMLRLTGWISLCKKVRDECGRVRGNIYAQHDEPLGYRDAETFDPGWLRLVEQNCQSKNKAVRMTALAIVNDILQDAGMRHRHNRLALIESRLNAPSTPLAMMSKTGAAQPGSKNELSKKIAEKSREILSSKSELRHAQGRKSLSTQSKIGINSMTYNRVRNSNHNVRSFTQSVIKETYVAKRPVLPESFLTSLSGEDRQMVSEQFGALSVSVATGLSELLQEQMRSGRLANPTGWMFTMLKRARQGELRLSQVPATPSAQMTTKPVSCPEERSASYSKSKNTASVLSENRASADQISAAIAAIRKQFVKKPQSTG